VPDDLVLRIVSNTVLDIGHQSLGLRVFEACAADISDVGEETRAPRSAG
jgi:hypothetical protein